MSVRCMALRIHRFDEIGSLGIHSIAQNLSPCSAKSGYAKAKQITQIALILFLIYPWYP
jgi:hypothetical protein